MSDQHAQNDDPVDLDAVEAELAGIELMLERLDESEG